MAKTKQMRYRIDAQKAKLYEETLKADGIKAKDDYDRYVSEVIRTRGLAARKLLGNDLRVQAEQILSQVKIDEMNMQEMFTDAMNLAVDRALSRKNKDGTLRTITFDSIEYYVKQISQAHNVPETSVLACMRQRIHDLYLDDNGELDRILRLLESIQDQLITEEAK